MNTATTPECELKRSDLIRVLYIGPMFQFMNEPALARQDPENADRYLVQFESLKLVETTAAGTKNYGLGWTSFAKSLFKGLDEVCGKDYCKKLNMCTEWHSCPVVRRQQNLHGTSPEGPKP